MSKKQSRPNRIIKLPRPLYDVLQNIAYWQKPPINVNDFVVELLMMLSDEHGKIISIEAARANQTMKNLIEQTNVLTDANQNNKFQEINV